MPCPNHLRYLWREVTINDSHILPMELKRIAIFTRMPLHHRDPFDRLLIAQPMVEQIPIASGDTAFDAFPVTRLWWP